MKKLFKREKGFTIIEVVLVLAIAGLIFLVVFLALPQLQKNRRDTQRKSDAGRMAAALESYAGNSNGNYPYVRADVEAFVDTYITEQGFLDPTTSEQYGYEENPSAGADLFGDPNQGDSGTELENLDGGAWSYYFDAECVDNGDVDKAGTAPTVEKRSTAIRMTLEQGVYCVDNQ